MTTTFDTFQTIREPGGPPDPEPIDLRPVSAYEAVTRQMVESLADDLREIKGRLNGLLFMLTGTIVLEFISRMVTG
jgi:hypothetical protein